MCENEIEIKEIAFQLWPSLPHANHSAEKMNTDENVAELDKLMIQWITPTDIKREKINEILLLLLKYL